MEVELGRKKPAETIAQRRENALLHMASVKPFHIGLLAPQSLYA